MGAQPLSRRADDRNADGHGLVPLMQTRLGVID